MTCPPQPYTGMPKTLTSMLFACLITQGSFCPAAEFVSVFSSYKMYPGIGDCGGHTLTIVQDERSRLIRGDLQTYEGNCEDSKVPIDNVQLDSGKRTLSFSALIYVQDGNGGLMVFGRRKFVGMIGRNRVKGEIKHCPINGPCTATENVNLPFVTTGTP
jgi:hypothetical protein